MPTSFVKTLLVATSLLVVLISPKSGHAIEEPGAFRFALLGGYSGLLESVGEGQNSGVSLGGSIGYRINQPFAIKAYYLLATHESVTHRDFGIGLDYYLNEELRMRLPWEISKFFPYLTTGLSFVSNRFNNINITGNSLAFFGGVGLDYQLTSRLRVGPLLSYQKAIEAQSSHQGQDFKTVQDSYQVLVRVIFSYFSSKE